MKHSKLNMQDVIQELRLVDEVKMASSSLIGTVKKNYSQHWKLRDNLLILFATTFEIKKVCHFNWIWGWVWHWSWGGIYAQWYSTCTECWLHQCHYSALIMPNHVPSYTAWWRKRTCFHMMNAHTFYDKCKSRELVTTSDLIGMSLSYRQIRKMMSELSQCLLLQFEVLFVLTLKIAPSLC